MLYQAYQAHSDIMVPVRAFAGAAATIGPSGLPLARDLTAVYELIARTGLTHERPPFAVGPVEVGSPHGRRRLGQGHPPHRPRLPRPGVPIQGD